LLNSDHNSNWIIDSGASHHLTADQGLFSPLQPLKEEITVTVGNGESIKAVGTGKVHFELPFGPRFSIDALYVPGISRSLLSVSQLNRTVPLILHHGHCYSGGRRIGILKDGLYELIATPSLTKPRLDRPLPFSSAVSTTNKFVSPAASAKKSSCAPSLPAHPVRRTFQALIT